MALVVALASAPACDAFDSESFSSSQTPADAGGGGPVPDAAAGEAGRVDVGRDDAAAIWRFDETSGGSLLDDSGNGNVGTLGTTTTREPGAKGQGLAFTGVTGAKPVFPSSPSIDVGGTAFTLALWVYLPAVGVQATGDQVLLAKPWVTATVALPRYQFGLEWDKDGTGGLDFYVGRPEGLYPATHLTVPSVQWVHVALVLDDGVVRGYVDGVVQTIGGGGVTMSARPTVLWLGADGVGGQPFTGKLDEVRIYARALDGASIAQLARP